MFYYRRIQELEPFNEALTKEAMKHIREFILPYAFKNPVNTRQVLDACENAIKTMTRSIIVRPSRIQNQTIHDLIAKSADNKTELLAVLEPTVKRIAHTSLFQGYSATIRRKDVTSVEVNLTCWIADVHGIKTIEREGTRLSCHFRIPADLWKTYLRKIETEMHRLNIKDAEEMHRLGIKDAEKLRIATQSNPQQ